MADCVFCRIVRGELACHKLFESEAVLAFLDHSPLVRGHALLVPRTHAVLLQDLASEAVMELARVLHELVPVLCRCVGAPAATVALHNGREAGQAVPHLHWHVVPRTAGDGGGPIHALFHRRPQLSEPEQTALAADVRTRLES
jgi:histidine triad (HIT) family protein